MRQDVEMRTDEELRERRALRAKMIAHLEAAQVIAYDTEDGVTSYRIERALDQARADYLPSLNPLRVFYRTFRASIKRALEQKYYQRIYFSGYGISPFVRFPRPEFLVALDAEQSPFYFSLSEMRTFFRSIETACERRDSVHVTIGELSMTTDAAPNPKHPDRVVVRFKVPWSRYSTILNREKLLSRCKEFFDIFGRTEQRATEGARPAD